MKRLIPLLLCAGVCAAHASTPGRGFIPAFDIKPNDLALSRTAQATQYFDKIGPYAGLMGYESGQFEMWVWPWKVLRNFDLQFLLGTSTQPIPGRDIVRTISVTPEVTTLTYTYESFTVREHILIPRDEPGALLLLDVHTTAPLAIIPGFLPVMQPMWPAGVGGQFSYWDDETNAYVISEGQWRAIFLCGSPAGKQMAAPPAHMFADNPLQFRIDVSPGETDGKFIPIVIAGSMPDTTTWKMKFDSVKATYNRIWKDAAGCYEGCYDHFRKLRDSTMSVVTPDREINLAYEWGKVALDNLLITNPRLGTGMVAGYGLSGGGERPGFAWFFGADAFVNILTLNSVGMFSQARAALSFTQKWQRQDDFPIRKKHPSDPPVDVGKMAHELSQSDGLCDWWNDYHYGYNHADTSPWYLVAMADYVRSSGDTSFLRQSWRSVKQAYIWCLSKDSDHDGLMDLKGAGLGALEFGKLVGIYADVYTCGVFLQAVKEMKFMAELVGDSAEALQAQTQFEKAAPRMEELFWLRKEGFYAYGATDKAEQVREKTPWAGAAMMFGLLDEERTEKSIEAMNSADLSTDWGVRSLSNTSPLFDPSNYNYGAVWPFIASFFNTAQFRHHFPYAGYQLLRSTIGHVFDHALGEVPEVFSGSLNEKLAEGYHHQGFSTTGYMLPLVRGYLGVEVDALKKIVTISPAIAGGWDTLTISKLRVGSAKSEFKLWRSGNSISISVDSVQGETFRLSFHPEPPLGGEVRQFESSLNASHRNSVKTDAQDIPASVAGMNGATYMISYGPSIELSAASYSADPGQQNRNPRIISTRSKDKRVEIFLEGKPGSTADYHITPQGSIKSLDGASLEGDRLIVTFDAKSKEEFVRRDVVIELK